MFYNSGEDTYDSFRTHCIGNQLKFAILPKKCHITGRTLWLEYAYKQTAMWTGPGDAIFEHRWYDKTEFLVARIKGDI